MKKYQHLILWSILILLGIWIYFYSGLNEDFLTIVFINVIAFVSRDFIIDISSSLIKNLLARYIFIIIINIIWLVFVFWLIFYLSPIFFVAILSFLIVAISLTFQNLINNIASGLMLLSSEGFEAGDLIETNAVQGRISEITLNHVKIIQFDGSVTYIPNKNVFNAPVTRYTHKEPKKSMIKEKEGKKLKRIDLTGYIKKFSNVLTGDQKLTRYIKVLELLGTVNLAKLDEQLKPTFEKYESIFGIKPFFYPNNTTADRLSITIQVLTKKPEYVLRYLDPFLKEVLFSIYQNEVNLGWDDYNNSREGGN